MEQVWNKALTFLTQDLGASRAVVLHEEDPDRDFEVIAAQGIDGESFWRDANIDFSVLSSVCSSGLPENRRNHLLCAPGRDRNGRVVALLYADRPKQPFGVQALNTLADFMTGFEVGMQEVHVTRPKTSSRSLSRVGGANTRVAFLLAEQGLLTLDEGEQFLKQAEAQGEILERLIVKAGRLREEDILRAQARYYQLEPWLVNLEQVNPDVARLVPLERARELGAIPIALTRDQLGVALALPDNAPALEELRRLSGRNVVVRLVGRLGFQRILEALAGLEEPAPAPAAVPASTEKLLAGRYRVNPMPLLVCRFSSLLSATDVETSQSVVLRRLEPPTQDKAQARSQTLAEGRRMSQLNHPNLPRVERILEDEEQIYLVLEDFSGPTLEQLVLQHGPVPAHTLPQLIEQLMSVLEFLHSQNPAIIHRDLRPEVVILTGDGTIKLAEFGLAKMHADAAAETTSFRAHGSPFFASPEQLLGEPSHPRQDLYALGAILFYLATGAPPGKALERCFSQAQSTTVAGLPDGFPLELANFVSRLLEPDGDKRPQGVSEARVLLGGVPTPEPTPAAVVSPDETPVAEFESKTRKIHLEKLAQVVAPTPAGLEHLLQVAQTAGVSYLHFEPDGRFRWRSQGALESRGMVDPAALSELKELTSRSGQLSWRGFNLRVSALGTPPAESLVVRLLPSESVVSSLTDLGMPPAAQERLRPLLAAGPGILAVAGPGRTSTLYACLKEGGGSSRKLITLDDPPKYRLPEAVQVRVKPGEAATILEEALHHDPDVILLSHLGTLELGRSVAQAAQAGCLVLVGMRTSDAFNTLLRLHELTGDASLLAGAIAQRLTRRLCLSCREEVPVTPEYLATFERYRVAAPRCLFAARGCAGCQEGYQGRLGIFEVLSVTPEVRALLLRSAPAEEMRRLAFMQGFQPLLQDGLQKVAAGLTSMDELSRVCR